MARGAKTEVAPHVGIPLGPHIEEYLVPAKVDQDGVQVSSAIGKDGKEYPDPIPMSPPVGYTPPSDIMQLIERMFERGKAVLEAAEIETEEEANDFNCEDDPLDELTPYEKVFSPPAPAAAAPAVSASVTPPAQGGAEPSQPKAAAPPSEPVAKGS